MKNFPEKIELTADQIEFRACTLSDLPAILNLQEQAFEYLEDPDLLRRNTEPMLKECLLSPHLTIGAYHKNSLIAFAILYVPFDDSENLALSLKHNQDVSFITNSANFKLVICDVSYRGNQLQYLLMNKIEAAAKAQGIKMLCATVSPHNIYSRNNFIKSDYIYSHTLTKYGGLERELYYKPL